MSDIDHNPMSDEATLDLMTVFAIFRKERACVCCVMCNNPSHHMLAIALEIRGINL